MYSWISPYSLTGIHPFMAITGLVRVPSLALNYDYNFAKLPSEPPSHQASLRVIKRATSICSATTTTRLQQQAKCYFLK
jgi:hypothetical protein